MKRSKIHRNKITINDNELDMEIYYISIGKHPKRWFNVKELYDIVTYGNKKNPITNEVISELDIQKIKTHMSYLVKNDNVSKTYDILPIQERLDDIEIKLEGLLNNFEEHYAELIKLRSKIDNI